MTATPELLPCPFCGATANGPFNYSAEAWAVDCFDCSVKCLRKTKSEVIAAWNQRAAFSAIPSAPHQHLATSRPSERPTDNREVVGLGHPPESPAVAQGRCEDAGRQAGPIGADQPVAPASAKGEAELRREAWRPIATAPKIEGRTILASYWPSGYVELVHWRVLPPGSYAEGQWQIEQLPGRDPSRHFLPTHWMPLPPPPISPSPSDTGETQ